MMSSMAPPGVGKVMTTEFGEDDRLRDAGTDDYDVLRDLFLGAEESRTVEAARPPSHVAESQEPAAATVRATPFIDALVLGHLPVLQSAWVMQYARDTASQRAGPIALLRVRADETTIDLVGLGSAKAPSQRTSFDEAVSAAAAMVVGIIIRVDATSEPALARLDTIDTLTLLTGADEVAILASYQTVKKLFPASDDSGPEARLAIMGASPEKAMEAASKLEKTAAAFLERQVSISACVARIGPGKSSLLYRGKVDGAVADVVARVRKAMLAKSALVAPAKPPEPLPVEWTPSAPASLPTVEPAAPATSVVSRLGHIQHEAHTQQAVASAAPSADPRPLSAHLKQLTPTSIHCPYEAGVELALDPRGGLHLLVHAESTPSAVASLMSAGGWTKSHLSLIVMAIKSQGLHLDERTAPTMHVFAPTVKEHRGLSDAGVHLHLLARVEIEGRKGWFCTEVG